MSETQKLTFKDLICSKLEGNGIQAVPSGNYIAIRIPGLGTTYLKIEEHITNA